MSSVSDLSRAWSKIWGSRNNGWNRVAVEFRSKFTSTSGLVSAILNSGCRPTSARVDSPISELGVVENLGVAGAISFVVVLQAKISVFTLISKHFRFSGRHIGFLEGGKYGLKAPSCSQIILRKSREGASLKSKWFGNCSKKSDMGAIYPPPPPFTV